MILFLTDKEITQRSIRSLDIMVYTEFDITRKVAEFGKLASERNAATSELAKLRIGQKMGQLATLRDQMRHHLNHSSKTFGVNANGTRGQLRDVQFNTLDSIDDEKKWSSSIKQLVVYVSAPKEAEPFKEGLATLPQPLPTKPDAFNEESAVHLWDQFTDWVKDVTDKKGKTYSIYRSSTNPSVVVKIPKV